MSNKKKEINQDDRRVQRTHQLLREALLALIVEKGYDAVGVQDITERANIGRATFYLHYPDKEHLALACVQEAMIGLKSDLASLPQEDGLWNTADMLVHKSLAHIEKQRELYSSLLSNKSSYSIVMQFQIAVVEVIQQHLEYYLPKDLPASVPVSLLAEHLAGSLVAMIKWWLNNTTDYSAEQIATLHIKLVGQGLFAALVNTED